MDFFLKKLIGKNIARYFFVGIISFTLLISVVSAQEKGILQEASLMTTRIHAGGYLPVEVKLVNLESPSGINIEIIYRIVDAQGKVILNENQIVTVDKEASISKKLLVPENTPPGKYWAESDIKYLNHESAATSSFEFTVERRLFGVFIRDLALAGSAGLIIVLLCFLLAGY
jgi:hypothetical protein